MKKVILLCFICILMISLISCQKKELNVFEGMTYKEYEEITEEIKIFSICEYAFYEEKDNYLVIKFSSDSSKIEKVCRYSKKNINRKNADEIQVGMTIYEVVERIGIPTSNTNFGLIVLMFQFKFGQSIRIQFDSRSWTVLSVI